MIRMNVLGRVVVLSCWIVGADVQAVPASQDKHFAACRAVVEAANQRSLGGLSVPSGKLDINNDGKPEKVSVISEGTAHFEHVVVADMDGKEIELAHDYEDDWESDNLRWALDRLLIRHGGQIYILGMTNDYLQYLSRVGKDNVERVVCQFAQREQPVERLVSSKDDKLCKAAMARDLNYVKYEKVHALTHASIQEAGFYATMSGKLAALIDINNDGQVEPVVQFELASGRGRGCDAVHLGVLNKARNKLDMGMTKKLPEPACDGVIQAPFLYEGKIYIEKLGVSSNVHKVVQLKGEAIVEICHFDVAKVNFILGDKGE